MQSAWSTVFSWSPAESLSTISFLSAIRRFYLRFVHHFSCFSLCLLFLLPSPFPLSICAVSLPPSSLLPPPLPLFPPSHQSLALASPSRTYGMMDRRASGASKARGHLPGAPRRRGSQGPAMQPRPRTSVSGDAHTQHSGSYCARAKLTLAPVHFGCSLCVATSRSDLLRNAVRSSVCGQKERREALP